MDDYEEGELDGEYLDPSQYKRVFKKKEKDLDMIRPKAGGSYDDVLKQPSNRANTIFFPRTANASPFHLVHSTAWEGNASTKWKHKKMTQEKDRIAITEKYPMNEKEKDKGEKEKEKEKNEKKKKKSEKEKEKEKEKGKSKGRAGSSKNSRTPTSRTYSADDYPEPAFPPTDSPTRSSKSGKMKFEKKKEEKKGVNISTQKHRGKTSMKG